MKLLALDTDGDASIAKFTIHEDRDAFMVCPQLRVPQPFGALHFPWVLRQRHGRVVGHFGAWCKECQHDLTFFLDASPCVLH